MENGLWRFVGASAIGTSHLEKGTECQDRYACKNISTTSGEVMIAVIADGAGSTSEGQTGAQIACDSFIEEADKFLNLPNASTKLLGEEFALHWISHFQKMIADVAAGDGNDLREYASTFVGAIIGQDCGVFYQVGDGGIVFSSDDEALGFAFGIEPDDAEYVNMTDFLTDETAHDRLKYSFIGQPIEDLVLFSDGVSSIAVDYKSNVPHEPFLVPMIAPLRNSLDSNGLSGKLEGFLSSPQINEKTDDDKTIILATRVRV